MEGCDGELDGSPGELTFRRYHRFASGGAKVIWGEACAVTEEGRATPRQIYLNDRTRTVFAKMVKETRAFHRKRSNSDGQRSALRPATHAQRQLLQGRAEAHVAPDPLLVGRYKRDRLTRR